MTKKKPTILAIIDGWGINENQFQLNNPFKKAKTDNIDYLLSEYPNARLNASGSYVGLPEGQMGNSEVGHMIIGSGRVIWQDLSLINNLIENNNLRDNIELQEFTEEVKRRNNVCHIIGLASDGGVHSHIEHLLWFIYFFAEKNIEIYLHLFLDGRDSIVISEGKYIEYIEEKIKGLENIFISSLSGRYYSMDRDKRWQRTGLAYKAIFEAEGLKFQNYREIFDYHQKLNISDEFFLPSIMGDFEGIKNGDSIFSFNFRTDRIRQILDPLIDENFSEFKIKKFDGKINLLTMSDYSEKISKKAKIILRREEPKNILGEVIADNLLTQLRIAETEKYAHVTFFMNNGKEGMFRGEDRILIDSPKIPTYDMKPEMSAYEITEKLIDNMEKYDLIILNFANLDMLGHTGNFNAAIRSIEVIDECLGKIMDRVKKLNGNLLITSDHGNIEMMQNNDGLAHTQHTTNLVPIILFSEDLKKSLIKNGSLVDIAPTILDLLNLEKPVNMTGKTLLKKFNN